MTNQTPYTYTEITSQPKAWAEAIEVVRSRRSQLQAAWEEAYDQIIYVGCGSTYYLSQAAAALLQELTGKRIIGLPASELLVYPRQAYPDGAGKTLLVVSSRSGRTTETLRAVEAFRKNRRGRVVLVTNSPDAPLVDMADISLPIPGAQEIGVAQTRSFAAMYVANTAMSAIFAGREDLSRAIDGLIPIGERLLQDFEGTAEALGKDQSLSRFFYLGSGPHYGLACEASLKLKEISLSMSEPFHFLEFRHGPVSMVEPETLVVGLLSDASRTYEAPVLEEVKGLGGRTLSLAESEADISFYSGLPEEVRGVLYLPVLQLLAYYRAAAAGLNPDKLKNLPPFIKLAWPQDE